MGVPLTWEQKLAALTALAGPFCTSLHMRVPGNWYVSLKFIEVVGAGGVLLSSPIQAGRDPQEAVEQCWEQHAADGVIVKKSLEGVTYLRWAGFLWETVPKSVALDGKVS